MPGAISLRGTSNALSPADSSYPYTVTIGSEKDRKIVFAAGREGTNVLTGVTFDGVALTQILAYQHTGNATLGIRLFYYDVPFNVPAGDYELRVNLSTTSTTFSFFWWVLTGCAAGPPEAIAPTPVEVASATNISNIITSTAGAVVIGVAQSQQTAGTYSWTNLTTRNQTQAAAAWTTGTADAENVTAGSRTVTATHTASANRHLLALVSFAESVNTRRREADRIRRNIHTRNYF